jgi:membrane-associated phospholipid phosphatase
MVKGKMEQASMRRNLNPVDRWAEFISRVFHPLLIVIPTMILAMVQLGSTLGESIFWTVLAVLIVNLPMALLLLLGVRSGKYSDASVSIREQRTSVYTVGGICLVILLAILIIFNAPIVLIACLISAVIATALGFWINRYTKLSLHSAAMAGCTAVMLWTAPWLGGIMLLFAPIVGWSRIHLKHHTPAQILIGWTVAMVSVFVIFWVLL